MRRNACMLVFFAWSPKSILPKTFAVEVGDWVPGPHQNQTTDKLPSVLGSDLQACDLTASDEKTGGYCDFEHEGGSARSLCVQPPQLMGKPFCLQVLKYGMYLQAQPSTISDINIMRPKCASTPEAIIFSAYADEHFLSPEFHAVAAQVCKTCLIEPAKHENKMHELAKNRCLRLVQGSTKTTTSSTRTATMTTTTTSTKTSSTVTSTLTHTTSTMTTTTTTTITDMNIETQISLMAFLSIVASVSWMYWTLGRYGVGRKLPTWLVHIVRTCHDGVAHLTRSNKSRAGQRAPSDQFGFVGTWEMLGQQHVITEKEILWQDRKVSPILSTENGQKIVIVNDGGRLQEASLQRGGRELVWDNGSVWFRVQNLENVLHQDEEIFTDEQTPLIA